MAGKDRAERAMAGEGTALERYADLYLGNFIHLFLSLLAALVLVAAAIAAYDTAVRDIPKLWRQGDEYQVLHMVLQKILLIAIAAELGLLLLFHRTRTAIEVVIFVIARRMVALELSGLDLLLGAAALAGLIIVRSRFLSAESKTE